MADNDHNLEMLFFAMGTGHGSVSSMRARNPERLYEVMEPLMLSGRQYATEYGRHHSNKKEIEVDGFYVDLSNDLHMICIGVSIKVNVYIDLLIDDDEMTFLLRDIIFMMYDEYSMKEISKRIKDKLKNSTPSIHSRLTSEFIESQGWKPVRTRRNNEPIRLLSSAEWNRRFKKLVAK